MSEQVTLWKNFQLLTMTMGDESYGLIRNGAIAASGGRIIWLGRSDDIPDFNGPDFEGPVIEIDGQGQYLSPGLVDCHTHLIYGGNRVSEFEQRLQGVSYEQIARKGGGILSTVMATREASEDSLYLSAEQRLIQLQKSGVTTIEIKSGYGLDLLSELKMLRVARKLGQKSTVDVQTTFLGAHAVSPEFSGDADGYMEYVTGEMLEAVVRENLADAVDGFCENIAFSPDHIEDLFMRAREMGLDLKLHAEQLSNSGGARLAAEYGALSVDHLEHLDEEGVRAMAANGTVAVLLPGAFYSLKDETVPPIDLLRKYQVPMAVATDSNPGSSPVLSLSLMLNMASTLFGLTPEEALLGVTRYGAAALGLKDRGVLEVGKKADFALWNIDHPAALSYQLGGNLCTGIVKDGVIVSLEI